MFPTCKLCNREARMDLYADGIDLCLQCYSTNPRAGKIIAWARAIRKRKRLERGTRDDSS